MKLATIITIAFVLSIPPNIFALDYSDEEETLYFRGNNGGMNSTCDNLTYHIDAVINSDVPVPIKIEIVSPSGKVIGIYEDTTRGGLSLEIDVDYEEDGEHIIRVHYGGEIYVKDYGWSSNYTPSRGEQIQCLLVKEINNSGLDFLPINREQNIRYLFDRNMPSLKNILGEEKFQFYEPIINTNDIIDKQRKGIERIPTDYAIEQLSNLKIILNDYADVKIAQNFELVKKIVSDMDELNTDEKVDTIYAEEQRFIELKKIQSDDLDFFINQIKFQYHDLDRRDEQKATSERIALEQKLAEKSAKQKILDELEQDKESKNMIGEESNLENNDSDEIICSQGFEPTNGKCHDPPVVEKSKKLEIASFVDKSKDPQYYVDRYNNEPQYKKWFDDNYPQYDSIGQAVGLALAEKIPKWVKNIFLWYGQDQVSEDELLNAIKYLISEKILVIT